MERVPGGQVFFVPQDRSGANGVSVRGFVDVVCEAFVFGSLLPRSPRLADGAVK